MIQDYPQTLYFYSKWMLQNQPGKNKRIKQLSQSLQKSTLLEISSWLLWDLQLPDSARCWCDAALYNSSTIEEKVHQIFPTPQISLKLDWEDTARESYLYSKYYVPEMLNLSLDNIFRKHKWKLQPLNHKIIFKLLVQTSLSQLPSSKAFLNSQVFMLHHQENF